MPCALLFFFWTFNRCFVWGFPQRYSFIITRFPAWGFYSIFKLFTWSCIFLVNVRILEYFKRSESNRTAPDVGLWNALYRKRKIRHYILFFSNDNNMIHSLLLFNISNTGQGRERRIRIHHFLGYFFTILILRSRLWPVIEYNSMNKKRRLWIMFIIVGEK